MVTCRTTNLRKWMSGKFKTSHDKYLDVILDLRSSVQRSSSDSWANQAPCQSKDLSISDWNMQWSWQCPAYLVHLVIFTVVMIEIQSYTDFMEDFIFSDGFLNDIEVSTAICILKIVPISVFGTQSLPEGHFLAPQHIDSKNWFFLTFGCYFISFLISIFSRLTI